ncbi:MAG: GPR1/FUN34/YaaH family transporter [Syntrophomonadaceae bacterium]
MSSGEGGWANPGPAGLTALAVACFTFYAVLCGKVPGSALPFLACWLMGGFVVQLVVGIIELREGALLGGNVFLFFSGFFMLEGALEFWVETLGKADKAGAAIGGWAWLVLLITLVLWTAPYMKTSPAALSLAVIVLDIGVFFVTCDKLKILMDPHAAGMYGGYCLLITGILGIYVAAGIQINSAFGKQILPLGGPMIK